MCSQTRNSYAKAFNNWSRSKNLKPKNLRGGQFEPPPLSRLLRLNIEFSQITSLKRPSRSTSELVQLNRIERLEGESTLGGLDEILKFSFSKMYIWHILRENLQKYELKLPIKTACVYSYPKCIG